MTKELDYRYIILGTKSDNEVLNSVYHPFAENERVLLINDLSIKNAMYLISRSKLILSACTSSLHMGTSVDANMVSLYGPTNYSITGPASKRNRIVRMGYSCSPCFRDQFNSGCSTPRCMTDISVDQVFKAVKASLSDEETPVYPKLSTTSAKKFKL